MLTHQDNSWIQWIVVILFILLIIFTFSHTARASPITSIRQLDWYADSSQAYIDKESGLWSNGRTAIIIDIQTGISFTAIRYRGSNHADFEPATQNDTDRLKSIYGRWSWDRRPVVVIIAGEVFAASMNGMPHGTESVHDNGYPGHSCIHFLNSKTHGSGRVDKAHQAAVIAAYTITQIRQNFKEAMLNEVPIQEKLPRKGIYAQNVATAFQAYGAQG